MKRNCLTTGAPGFTHFLMGFMLVNLNKYNGQNKKDKGTNNGLLYTTQDHNDIAVPMYLAV